MFLLQYIQYTATYTTKIKYVNFLAVLYLKVCTKLSLWGDLINLDKKKRITIQADLYGFVEFQK